MAGVQVHGERLRQRAGRGDGCSGIRVAGAFGENHRETEQPHMNGHFERTPEPCEGPLTPHASTRDAPVNLSDFHLRTHQHRTPARAHCCHSLLLDPDATIGIDLHKWLFLLVTGRGE
jgi:hypothetical protein